jgi:hypothetical protein
MKGFALGSELTIDHRWGTWRALAQSLATQNTGRGSEGAEASSGQSICLSLLGRPFGEGCRLRAGYSQVAPPRFELGFLP